MKDMNLKEWQAVMIGRPVRVVLSPSDFIQGRLSGLGKKWLFIKTGSGVVAVRTSAALYIRPQ